MSERLKSLPVVRQVHDTGAQNLFDFFEGPEGFVWAIFLSEFLPDVLSGIEFRAVCRLGYPPYVVAFRGSASKCIPGNPASPQSN